MTSDAYFDVTDSGPSGSPVLNVGGEIDVATSPELHERLSALLEAGSSLVIVNLTDVSFIDSTGLGVLVGAVQEARAGGGDLRLVVTRPQTLKLLELTGLDEVFTIMSSTSEAVKS
jgi:anti-sigma B factor antagonist